MLKLSYKELFTDLDFEGSYPVEHFAKVIPKLIGTSRDSIHLDFSGIDRLSDEVFYILKEELKVTQKQNVEVINLTGCSRITDRGIEILSDAFNNLKELILIGCNQITQLSLVFLMDNCIKLEKLSAQFTKISYISNAVESRWGEQSIICNKLFKENELEDNLPTNLVILAMNNTITWDIGHYIVTGTIKTRKIDQPIIFQPNAIKINDTNINIIQLFCPTAYMAPFICERSLFIIATDLESETNNAFVIIQALDFIRGIAYCCPIQIFSFTNSPDIAKLEELDKLLQLVFYDQQVNMKEHLDQEHFSKSFDKSFIDQWRYVQSLSAIDPEHISLQLIGLYRNDSKCEMSYCSTICKPSTTAKIEQAILDFNDTFVNVRDSMDRINKADISETKSFQKFPEGLEKIITCLIQLFNRSQTVTEFISDPLLITPFRDYKVLINDENPEHTLNIIKSFFESKEELKNSSRGTKLATAFGIWIEAKWTICEKLAPLKNKANEFESFSQIQNDKSPLEQIKMNLKFMTKYMYQHMPSKATEAISVVIDYINKQSAPIITIHQLITEINVLSKSDTILVLDQIQTIGKVISLINIGLIIIDVGWFVNCINTLLTNWNSPLNNDRVWFITSQAVMSNRVELGSVLSGLCDNGLFQNLLNILQYYGLILSVNLSWNLEPKNWEPLNPIEHFNKMLFVSWHQLSLKPDSNAHLVVNKPDMKSNQQRRVLHNVFPDYNSNEFNKDDISFKFSFKFRVGIPSNLFCQVVSKISVNFRTILLWSQGILVREGAVEVLIIHNIHASRGTSSFDIESRIRGSIDGRRPVAVREHKWSVLSEIITIIEAFILEYPHLHHKVRQYCRGQCYKELTQENTISPTEISRNLNPNYDCNVCREYQMSRSDWLYILGRQMILPNHDFDKKNSCKSCWKRKPYVNFLWRSQQKVFPTFPSKVFYSKNNKNIQGNLIKSGPSESAIISRLKCMTSYLQYTRFQIIDPTNTIIVIYQKLPSIEKELFRWNLETGDIITELKRDKAVDKYQISPGNIIAFQFLTNDLEIPMMKIRNNHTLIGKFTLIQNANIQIRIKVAAEVDESEKIKMIISDTDAGVVGAFHFRPGMILLMKGETKWEPAVITSIKFGKLNCQPLSTIDLNAREIAPMNNQLLSTNSTNILPPGFYPSEINTILDSKNQRALAESWYKIFSEYSEFTAVPFGLFPRLVDKPAYAPLSMFGDESRECTTSVFCPSKILKLMFFNKPLSNRTLTSFIPLPHPLTPIQLLMPQRNVISHNQNHALHRLCPGSLWRNYIRDTHPMNEAPYHMNEGEAKYYFQGDFIVDVFIIIKNFATSFSAIYQNIDQCFPEIDPDINKDLLRDAIINISKVYRDIILFDIVAKIHIYSNNILSFDRENEGALTPRKPKNRKNKKVFIKKTTMAHLNDVNDESAQLPWSDDDMVKIQSLLEERFIGCESHRSASNVMGRTNLGSYCRCIANIAIKRCEMDNVAETALVTCKKLRKLEVDFGTMMNISWIVNLPTLSSLTLSNCELVEIGPEIIHLKESLKQLCFDGNPIKELPEIICSFTRLNSLELNNTLITALPNKIGNLHLLKYLSVEHTKLSSLPESFSQLNNLVTLKLSGVTIQSLFNKKSSISLNQWTEYCNKTNLNGYVLKETKIFDLFQHLCGNDSVLIGSKLDEFKALIFENIPRFQEFPTQIFNCNLLQTLIFSNQAFPNVPDDIQNLKYLKRVVFDNCLKLQAISPYVGTLPLEILSCQNCDILKTPPYEIRKQGMRTTISYLLRLVSGSEACYRTKLMLVGLGGAGKTSLMRALTNDKYCAPQIAEEAITDGIDINSWSTKTDNKSLKFSIWDFAGQTLYYNTHQFFLTGRAIYLLIWNVRQGFEHAGLDFWLNSITCHAPTAPIFIVGTHSDKVDRSEIPTNEFESRYPSVVGFFFISSLTGKGVKELHDKIVNETKKQPYFGEIVPNAWLLFEKDLISQRSTADYLKWDAVKKLANNNAIYDGEIHQAVRFLHDLGSIQYFEFPLLKDFVIINSQWLVDVMACVVSVKNSIIENGKLEHSKIKFVWSKYPESIHNWLLRLTEIFDLTFSVPGQNFNFVPCLLPNEQPDFYWADFVDFTQTREANMFYQFEYLPPGLFNRAQVRLSQFSDSFVIWQNGSLLNKNDDKALLTKLNETTLKVCARGFWPENILFIIHEMFETLISEAFSGVKYEYQLSCKKCIAEREPFPYVFNKSILQRAIQSKTMFIQCHRNFHIITMSEIQESTPPDSIEDYDLQFKKSVHFISANREQINHSLMILVADLDYQNETELLNTPKRLAKDLNKNQYTVWCEPLIEGTPEDKYIDMLTRSEAVISVVSGNFTNNKLCMDLLKLAKNTLRKNLILALIDKKYTESSLGFEIAGDKYINFERVKVYDNKFNELLHDLGNLLEIKETQTGNVPKHRVFISYCWDNSQRAFDKGNSKVLHKDAIGWGDPRDIKDYIEQQGLSCWIDVEMIGSSSVYSEITTGLRHSEIMVACLSKEYAQSDACKKEFLYARQNLNLPIVIAEVGCNHDWIQTEIGLLSIEYAKIQFQTENPTAFTDLYTLVSSAIPAEAPKAEFESNLAKMNKIASEEDFELIQRKIFRLLSSGFGSEESRLYPRLFFIDIADEVNETTIINDLFSNNNSILSSSLSTNMPKISLCFKALCESETGWHTVDTGTPINLGYSELERLLILGAPYLFRITLLLKFSGGVNIRLFNPETNADVTKYVMELLEKNSKSWSYMKPIHSAIRAHVISTDINLKYGGLQSCCLNNGKVVWLCPEHSTLPYVSIIGSEESGSLIKLERKRTQTDIDLTKDSGNYDETISPKDNVLIDKLEEIIKDQFSDADSSIDNRKGTSETNKFLQMVTSTPKAKKEATETKSKTGILYKKLIPPLEVVRYPSTFQSKTCLIM